MNGQRFGYNPPVSLFKLISVLSLFLPVSANAAEKLSPKEPVKVAFIGDQGMGPNSLAVLELIKAEKADLVLHQGDFDVSDHPKAWDEQISSVLGPSFPYLASSGNHDAKALAGYKEVLNSRLQRNTEVKCEGETTARSSCTFRGLLIVLSGVGLAAKDRADFLDHALARDAVWKICSWHQNQRLLQVEGKWDEIGWPPYETCLKHGAIVATGHSHVYTRTHLMSSFEHQTVASKSSPLELKPGRSFAFASGLGGQSIRRSLRDLAANPWWAVVYSAAQKAKFGALFCTFRVGDDPTRASCYFKNIAGEIVDRFDLKSDL
jgi:predicted phosphodiesterase